MSEQDARLVVETQRTASDAWGGAGMSEQDARPVVETQRTASDARGGEGMSEQEALGIADGEALRRDILATLMPGFVGTALPHWLAALLREGLGGACVFGPNVADLDQVRELTGAMRAANPGVLIAIDEEGGDVTRLHYAAGSPFPGNAVLGRLDDERRTAAEGRRIGELLAGVGLNLDLAPDADVNSNPDNPVIGVRSFGAGAALVARHTAAWTRGLQSAGVAACAKHFPGHGDTALDSHLALPVVDLTLDELRERELLPFRAAIAAGARTIMTSHVLLPRIDAELPATLSPTILQGLLRDELGFDGVIVSDALDMRGASGERGIPEAAVLALAAGCDLLCIGTENTAEQLAEIAAHVAVAVADGRLPAARVREAADRVRALGAELAAAADADGRALGGAPGLRVAEPAWASAGEPLAPLAPSALLAAIDTTDAGRAWLAEHARDAVIVRVDTVANIAVGIAPWGPFAAASADPSSEASSSFAARTLVTVDASSDLPRVRAELAALGRPIAVVGKDLHRIRFARELVDGLRTDGVAVVSIDLGWPSADRAHADIATFGASRLMGEVVLELLHRASTEPNSPFGTVPKGEFGSMDEGERGRPTAGQEGVR